MDTSGFDTVARHIPLYRERLLALPGWVKDQAFDIHIASGQPLSLSGKEGALFLGKKGVTRAFQEGIVTTPQQLRELFLAACGRQGYVRLGENLRVGVCGTAVAEGGQVRSLRDITALVYRIPRQVPGCGDRLFLEGVPLERGVLVVGPPSSGKTTFLRDVARSLSLGRFGPSRRVAVVDERGELGGYDLGPNADVLRGYPKAAGLDAAIRTLSPEVAVLDELSQGDLEAVRGAAAAGVVLLASVHGEAEHLSQRPLCRALVESGAFGTAVCLAGRGAPGKVAALVPVGSEGGVGRHEAFGSGAAGGQRAAGGPGRGGAPQAPGPAAA